MRIRPWDRRSRSWRLTLAGPCFADADCGDDDTCAAPGQCSEPAGKVCFADSDCGRGATCVANGGGYNLHRNVIFRNANVPELPVTYFDAITGCGAGERCKRYSGPNGDYPRGAFSTDGGIALGSPTAMLKTVQKVCNPEQEEPCEFLSVPHNLQVYEERFERTHGYLRRCVQTAVYRYLDCGIFANGVARLRPGREALPGRGAPAPRRAPQAR